MSQAHDVPVMAGFLMMVWQIATLGVAIWVLASMPKRTIRAKYTFAQLNLAVLPWSNPAHHGIARQDLDDFYNVQERYKILIIMLATSLMMQFIAFS